MCPTTLPVLRGGGAAGSQACRALGLGAWETLARGGDGPWHLLPAIPLTGFLPRRGLASSPHCWATTAKKPLPQTPKSPVPPVCVQACDCVKLWVRLSASEPRVCLRRERAAGGPEPVPGFREHVQGACLKAPHPLPKKVRGPSVPWDLRLSRLPLQSPAWLEQATGQLCCWGCPPRALGGSVCPPHQASGGS